MEEKKTWFMNENGLVRGREVGSSYLHEIRWTCGRELGLLSRRLAQDLLVICARSVSLARDSFSIGTRKLGFFFVFCRRFVRYADEKWWGGSYSSNGTRFVRYADEKRGS